MPSNRVGLIAANDTKRGTRDMKKKYDNVNHIGKCALVGRCGSALAMFRGLWTALAIALAFSALTAGANTLSAESEKRLNAAIASNQTEKRKLSKSARKIEDGLRQQIARSAGDKTANGSTVVAAAEELCDCEIIAEVSDRLLLLVESAGGKIISKSVKYKSIHVLLPYHSIERLSEDADIKSIRRVVPRMLNKNDVSNGVVGHNVPQARETYGVSGAGVKVGVISDSARWLPEMQATGDLPSGVTILDGFDGETYDGRGNRTDTGEGSGMMEIVYDVAPDAKLFFATGFGTDPEFAEAIESFYANGCRVVVDDVGWPSDPAFQDGIVAQAINDFTAKGGVYFSSASNSGNKDSDTSGTWEGDFSDSGSTYGSYSGSKHSFSGSITANEITRTADGVALQWADSWDNPDSDYDLYIADADGKILASSCNGQGDDFANSPPYEYIDIAKQIGSEFCRADNPGLYVVVVKCSGTDRFLRIDTARGRLAISTDGSTSGHNAAAAAITCAAASAPYPQRAFLASDPVETYSSDGPRKVFFDKNGAAITEGNFSSSGGRTLQKPDVTAADNTFSYWIKLQFGNTKFTGTSAAAPHAAAIAALMLEANPSLDRDGVFNIMKKATFSGPNATWNRTKGYGILNAEECVRLAKESNPVPVPKIPAAPSPYVEGTTLKWNAVAGAKYYKVYRATNPYAEPEEYSGWQSGVSKAIVKPSAEGTAYFWFVKAASAQDDTTASGFSETKVVAGDSNYTLLPYSSAHTHTTYNEKTEFHLYPSTSAISATPYSGRLTLTSTIAFTKSSGSGITAKINGTDVANNPAIGNGGLYMGNASFAISANSNTSSAPRSCLFHSNATTPSGYSASDGQAFGKHYNEWYARPHYIYQSGVASMSIGQTSQSVSADGGAYSVSVTATPSATSWTASANRDWVHLYRTSSNGSGVLGYYVEPNEGSARTATITVAGRTLSISQALGIVEQKVTVSFNANGGASCADREYTVGAAYGSLPETTKTGYTFGGWYTASSGGTQITASSTVLASVTTLYARWTANTYSIAYSLDGGSHGTTHPSSATYDMAFYVSAPAKSGHTFTGWTVSSGLNTATAKWGATSSASVSLTSSSTKCANGAAGNVYFKNLRATSGGVTLSAQWQCDHVSTTVRNARAATCTEAGYTGDTVCTTCGATVSSGSTIPALGHQEGEGVVTKEPTATEEGVMTYSCIRCGAVMRTAPIPATGSTPLDLGFATFSNWDYGYNMFTITNSEGAGVFSSAPTRLFDRGELFRVVYGYGNFGETAISNATVHTHIEIISENGETASETTSEDTLTLESYRGSRTAHAVMAWTNLVAGVYTARVTLDAQNALADTNRANNVSEFVFALRDPLPLGDALGCANLVFETDSENWHGTRDGADPSLSYARTSHLGNYGTNVLSAAVSGAGTLSFDWKVSSEATFDCLEFLVDGVVTNRISGTNCVWQSVSHVFESGGHDVQWRFRKDESYYSGLDCAWLANVRWVPRTTVQVGKPVIAASGEADYVQLDWDPAENAAGYAVWRAESATGAKQQIHTVIYTVNTFNIIDGQMTAIQRFAVQDTTAVPGVDYWYWIAATNGTASTFSDAASGYRRVSLSLSKSTASLGFDGGTDSVTVTANTSWTATKSKDWLALAGASGSGSGVLSFSVAANTDASPRSGTIIVTAGGSTAHPASASVYVTQAAYVVPTVSVTFDANGGTGVMEAQIFQEGERKNLVACTFTKSGFHFTGWSEDPDAIEPAYADGEPFAPDADVVLYAVWRSNKHAVEFDANGGTGTMRAQVFTWNVAKELSACAFTREHYDFAGWATAQSGPVVYADRQQIQIDEDLTLYAVWTPKTYTVAFNGNGATGGAMVAQSFTYGTAQNLRANAFQKTGHDFKGWATAQGGAVAYADGASFSATADMTLYAVWEAKTYTVSFNGNGATSGAMAAQSFTYGTPQNLRANAFQKTGHDFKGWATAQGGAVAYADGASFSATADLTLYAVWEAKAYTVSFNGNGATSGAMAAQSFTYGTAQNLRGNTFQKTGHDFKGWATAQGGAVAYADGASFSATADMTLYAVWEAKTYTVTFNGNGATGGAMAAQAFTYGTAQNLRANAFQKAGHDFKGWATAQGGAVAYADGASFSATADMTLYAVWEAKTFTVRFLANDGTGAVAGTLQFTYGVAARLEAPTLVREGYTLAGWAQSANGGVVYVGGEIVEFDGDADLYAVWSAGLGGALAGTASLVWRTGGDAPWAGVALDGEDVARSGAIQDGASSWVAADVAGPGRLSFRWKVSSEAYRDYQIDYLSFFVDGEEMDWIGGEVEWETKTFDLDEGSHTLTWTYFKDEVDSDGEDCAWLDSVFFLLRSGVSFIAPDATSGALPAAINGWENDEVALPAPGDLRRAKHEFAGWTDGTATYSPGDMYALPYAAAALSAVWTAKIVATPAIDTPAHYISETSSASIACATPGATIKYTLDGSDPLGANGIVYTGPFAVSGCPAILAAATLDDWFDSAVATATVSRVWTAAEVMNAPERFFDLRAGVPWARDFAVSHDGVASLRSGAIGNDESTAFSTIVYGPGTASFWWKVSSEIFKNRKIDYLSFMVDGAESAWLGGEKDWTQCSANVSGDGAHTLSWIYSKDSEGSAGDDAAWVDEFVWKPAASAHVMVDAGDVGQVAIDRAWLEEKFPGVDAAASAAGLAANGKPVWQAYVAGYDPNDPNADFRATIRIVNGLPVVEPDPDLGDSRTYVIEGKPTLKDDWSEPDSVSRFFRIRVLPPDVSDGGGNTSASLAAPVGVTATKDREDGVLVSWQAVPGAISYELWKGESGAPDPSSLVGTGAETSCLDPDAASGIQSRYWVRATGPSSSSPLSSPVEGMKRLSAPQNVRLAASTDVNEILWDAVVGANSYEIWRGVDANVAAAEKLATVTSLSYKDSTADIGESYCYWVRASCPSGIGGFARLEIMSAPEDVCASQPGEMIFYDDGAIRTSGDLEIDLELTNHVEITWSAVDGAMRYEIYRATTNIFSHASLLAETSGNFHKDKNTDLGVDYYYWIRALAKPAADTSAMSSISAHALGYKAYKPISFMSYDGTNLTWESIGDNIQYRLICRSEDSLAYVAFCVYINEFGVPDYDDLPEDYIIPASVADGKVIVKYTVPDAVRIERIEAYLRKDGRLIPKARYVLADYMPLNVSASQEDFSTPKINISWDMENDSNVVYYEIWRSESNNYTVPAVKIAEVTNALNFVDTDVVYRKAYSYRVIACYKSRDITRNGTFSSYVYGYWGDWCFADIGKEVDLRPLKSLLNLLDFSAVGNRDGYLDDIEITRATKNAGLADLDGDYKNISTAEISVFTRIQALNTDKELLSHIMRGDYKYRNMTLAQFRELQSISDAIEALTKNKTN